MERLLRTSSEHPDFIALVSKLDQYLRHIDGAEHAFYAQFNKVDKIRHVVVLYVDDTPAACGAFKPFDDDSVEIKRMWTDEKYRGAGCASRVLAELEAWAKELRYKHSILETGRRMPDAVNLYLRRGYTQIGNYGQYIGVENSICFKKQLA